MFRRCSRLKSKTFIFLYTLSFTILLFFFYDSSQDRKSWPSRTESTKIDLIINPAPDPKTSWYEPTDRNDYRNVTILMWTKYYNNEDLVDHIKNESPVPDWCNVTFDRTQIDRSEAIVFHVVGSDFDFNDLPSRNNSQLWIYFTIESPAYATRTAMEIDGLFNRTMTYRFDSDYPCPYGYLSKLDSPFPKNPYYQDPNFPRTKTKLLAWTVSHCVTLSNRERLVKKLLQTNRIQIDIYGTCGTLECDKNQEIGCYERLGRIYKFYLSFENSLCRDYVTEKFSNALHAHMVPIVYGSGDYELFLPAYPKKGYINVKDFKTPNQLIDYLLYLDKNETAYAEYFEWKKYYKVNIRQGFNGFRKLCYDLQQKKKQGDVEERVYGNMHKWWNEESKCINDKILYWV